MLSKEAKMLYELLDEIKWQESYFLALSLSHLLEKKVSIHIYILELEQLQLLERTYAYSTYTYRKKTAVEIAHSLYE